MGPEQIRAIRTQAALSCAAFGRLLGAAALTVLPPRTNGGELDALLAREQHGWPGNGRELRDVIERTLANAPLPSVLSSAHLRMQAS